MSKSKRHVSLAALLMAMLSLAGCSSNVGIGMSVGIPIGDHGHISVGGGSSRWY